MYSSGGGGRPASSSVASSVAAAMVSRLRRPTSWLEYLPAITSPCSVTRTAPGLGFLPGSPPPRPGARVRPRQGPGGGGRDRLVPGPAAGAARAAAAVKRAHPPAVLAKPLNQPPLGFVELPDRGEITA